MWGQSKSSASSGSLRSLVQKSCDIRPNMYKNDNKMAKFTYQNLVLNNDKKYSNIMYIFAFRNIILTCDCSTCQTATVPKHWTIVADFKSKVVKHIKG